MFTKIVSKMFSEEFIARQSAEPNMQRVANRIFQNATLRDGKIYDCTGKEIGWYDEKRGVGWIDRKGFRQLASN